MSRVFKPKPKAPEKNGSLISANDRNQTTEAERAKSDKRPVKNQGVTLVETTPVKPKANTRSLTRGVLRSEPAPDYGDGEDIWKLPSSPDILLLEPDVSSNDSHGSTDEVLTPMLPTTPSKRRRKNPK